MPVAAKVHRSPQAILASQQRVEVEAERNRKKAGFYNSTVWKKFRIMRLAEQPLCAFCLLEGRSIPATDVDHILTLKQRPDLALVAENTRGLCHQCHSRRTAKDQTHGR